MCINGKPVVLMSCLKQSTEYCVLLCQLSSGTIW